MSLKFVVLSLCVLSCTALPHIRYLGNIFGNQFSKNVFLGSQKIINKPNMFNENRVAFMFPKSGEKDTDYIIKGIQQVDLTEHQAKIDFIEGGIGSKKVIMQVEAPPGTDLKTAFHFFGQKVTGNGEERFASLNRYAFPNTDKQLEPEIISTIERAEKPFYASDNA